MFHSFSNIFIAILFLIEQCSTSPTEQPPSLPYCTDFLIPVSAKAPSENLLLTAIPDLSNPTILVDFVTSHTTGLLGSLLGGTVSSTFNISARYCEPANQIANRSQIVQLLVHAITSTKDYWSGLSYPSGYNGEQYSWLAYASQVRCFPPHISSPPLASYDFIIPAPSPLLPDDKKTRPVSPRSQSTNSAQASPHIQTQ